MRTKEKRPGRTSRDVGRGVRRPLRAGVTVALGVLMALGALVGIASSGTGPHAQGRSVVTASVLYPHCAINAAVGTKWYWVPVVIVNSPFGSSEYATGASSVSVSDTLGWTSGGISWYTTTNSVVTVNITASSGATAGVFELTEWTVYSVHNVSGLVPENGPCTQPYVAEITQTAGLDFDQQVAGIESSDSNLPYNMSIVVDNPQVPVNGESVYTTNGIDNFGYADENDANANFCSGAGSLGVSDSTIASVDWSISLGASFDGVGLTGTSYYNASTTTTDSFTYHAAAGSGNYLLDSLTGATNAGLAFYWNSCPPSGGGGHGHGGGCVAAGTPILTPKGYDSVQGLSKGSAVEEYNLSLGRMVVGTLEYDNASSVTGLVNINDGQLVLTSTDQPIFVSNSTYTGWLQDPQNLTIGDYLFDPVTDEWVGVNSVVVEPKTSATVYDVITSGSQTFIANGVLADIKEPG
jgi:hypothetical protein